MSDKLTDSDIVEALENWIKNYEGTFGNFKTLGNALDLINRQKAEVERLKENNRAIMQTIADVHTEAVKEFAELAIKKICEQVSAPTPSESYIVEKCNQTINNLLKELAGDSNAEEKQ